MEESRLLTEENANVLVKQKNTLSEKKSLRFTAKHLFEERLPTTAA